MLVGGENRGVHSIEPKLVDGVWSVKKGWSQKEVALDMSTAVVNGELLYGLSHYDKGRFFCLDLDTGKVLWKGPGRTGQNVMFLSIEGYVVALVNDGGLQVITATGDSFRKAATYQVANSPTWAPPVLLKGGLLVKDHETLTRWSLPDASLSLIHI